MPAKMRLQVAGLGVDLAATGHVTNVHLLASLLVRTDDRGTARELVDAIRAVALGHAARRTAELRLADNLKCGRCSCIKGLILGVMVSFCGGVQMMVWEPVAGCRRCWVEVGRIRVI